MEDDLLVGLQAQVPEIVNIKKQKLLPASILVLVFNQILFHRVLDLWEDRNNLVESITRDMTNVTIVLGPDRGSSSILTRNKGDLSKIATRAKNLHESVITILICHRDLAFTFGNEVQFCSELTLTNYNFLWIVHKQLHLGE